MAVRSTVIAPPPPGAPRATVVLRAGPPPKRGVGDFVIGAIGLLLLLSTVGLAMALPDHEVLPQQFKVTWLDQPTDLQTQTFTFEMGSDRQSHDFLYEVATDDAYLITVKFEFKDDIAASAPDQFKLRLYDPQGNEVGPEVLATNLPGIPTDAVPVAPGVEAAPSYTAQLFTGQFSVALPKPADDIYETPDQRLNETTLAQQLEAKAHLTTTGTWKLRVTLLGAGGCPDPSSGLDAANRNGACRQELQSAQAPPDKLAQGQDGGNLFTVGVFSYSRFAPDIQKLG